MINEITPFQTDLIKSFALFYLLLVGNYIGDSLFTCFQIDYINRHKWVKLMMAFFLFYFLVTVFSNTGYLQLIPPIEKLLYSVFYFIGFLFVMRLDMRVSAIVLILIFIIYFIELNKQYYLNTRVMNKEDKIIFTENQYLITLNWPIKIRLIPIQPEMFHIINQIETALYYVILGLLVVGFISYGGEIKETVAKTNKITWLDVIVDTKICQIKNKRGFWHYFKVGLGVPI